MRLAGALLLLVAGVATGLATVLLHELWWCLPWAAVSMIAALAAVGRGWTTRLPLAIGFVVPVLLGAVPRGEGDYLVGTSTRGYLLLALATILLIAAIVTLPRPRPRKRGEESS